MGKRSQLEVMQTSFILMIVFFMLAIALIFVVSRYRQGFDQKIENSLELDQVNRYQALNFFPELRCTFNNVYSYDCLDLQRLHSFRQRAQENSFYYNNILRQMQFTVAIYDAAGNLVSEELIFRNLVQEDPDMLLISNPILVFDNEKKALHQGVLNIEIYS